MPSLQKPGKGGKVKNIAMGVTTFIPALQTHGLSQEDIQRQKEEEHQRKMERELEAARKKHILMQQRQLALKM